MSFGEDLKSSAQVWGDHNDAHITDDLPPAYTGMAPETIVQPPDLPVRSRKKIVPREKYHPVQAIAKWAKISWNKYLVPDAVVSADRTTITTTHTAYLTSQQALIKLLADQSELPPIPTMRITGSHVQGSNLAQKVDFDMTLNLSSILDLSKQARWHIKSAQVVPLQGPSGRSPASFQVSGNNTVQLEQLARQFLKDKSDRKSFVLSRTIDNLPTDVIEGLVRNLIASLNYRGKVNVTFPMQSGQFIVQKKPAAGTGAAVGGWFMNVLGLSPDVKYESLERVWCIGTPKLPSNETGDHEESEDETESSKQSDTSTLIKDWWNAWAPPIRDAIITRRQGKVGIEDWMEAQMGWRPQAANRDWGIDYV